MLNPNMPQEKLEEYLGKLTMREQEVVRAAIRWANSQFTDDDASELLNKKTKKQTRLESLREWIEQGNLSVAEQPCGLIEFDYRAPEK